MADVVAGTVLSARSIWQRDHRDSFFGWPIISPQLHRDQSVESVHPGPGIAGQARSRARDDWTLWITILRGVWWKNCYVGKSKPLAYDVVDKQFRGTGFELDCKKQGATSCLQSRTIETETENYHRNRQGPQKVHKTMPLLHMLSRMYNPLPYLH